MDNEGLQVMRKYFEMEIKPKFVPDDADHDDGEELDDDNCVTCALPRVPDDPKARVKKERIKFSHNELKQIFERTFTEITALVQRQVDMAQEATKKNVNVCPPHSHGVIGAHAYVALGADSRLG